jgi:hypothetical protein
MAKLLNIGFEYNGSMHYSLIRVKEKENCTEYQVTVMEGSLERLLYGNHIIKEVNGRIVADDYIENEQTKLKQKIVQALSVYLKENTNSSPDKFVNA